MSIHPTAKLSLTKRLAAHIGRRVTVEASGFSSEAAVLQQVRRPLARIAGQWFVPATVYQIELLDTKKLPATRPVVLRTTFRGTFEARLIRIGTNFLEIVETPLRGQARRLLLPLGYVISVEPIDG